MLFADPVSDPRALGCSLCGALCWVDLEYARLLFQLGAVHSTHRIGCLTDCDYPTGSFPRTIPAEQEANFCYRVYHCRIGFSSLWHACFPGLVWDHLGGLSSLPSSV